MQPEINRRDFLRLFLLATAGAAVAACEQTNPVVDETLVPASPTPQPAAIPTPSPAPTSLPAGEVILHGHDADVWVWAKEIKGRINHIDDCQEIRIQINGLEFPADIHADEFSSFISLNEGQNYIFAICRRQDGQEERSGMLNYHERLRIAPTATINIALDEENRVVLDGLRSGPSGEAGSRIIDHIWSERPGNPGRLLLQGSGSLPDREFTGEVSAPVITLIPPGVDGEYYVNLRVEDDAGLSDQAAIYFVVENGIPRIPDYDKENTAWVESAIVYGVIPRNFGTPAFRAVTERLDDLADLGVNALWLAPINVSPPEDYGYAVVDYFEFNPRYGTKEDFHRLVQEAHARGIRVLMDFVPNHSSDQHPYFQDTLTRGRDSMYWDFYHRDEDGNYTHYFSWTNLPNLNYDNPEVQNWMLEAFSYWVREFDVDGFRVDVAWGIRERNPEFWPLWRRELKRIKPDVLLLAEASARDGYYFDNGFDAAYDWTGELGKWAWELMWESYKYKLLSYNLDVALTNRPDGLHPDALVFRFLNNNDTGERFITKHGEAMTRVATALLLTLPGIPCIYTGDEVGAEFQPYMHPMPLSWHERVPGLRDYHKKLVALRKEIPSLHSRRWAPVDKRPIPQEVYAYVRYVGENHDPVLVVLNFFDEPAEVELQIPEAFSSLVTAGSLTDLLAEEAINTSGSENLHVSMPPRTARILIPND